MLETKEMKEAINKFQRYLEDERNFFLDQIATHVYNEAKNEVLIGKSVKLYKRTIRSLITMPKEELEKKYDKLNNASEQVVDIVKNNNVFDHDTAKRLGNISKSQTANVDFLYVVGQIKDFYRKREDIYKDSDSEECILIRESEKVINVLNFVESISSDNVTMVSIKDVLYYLENSNLKVSEKHNIINVISDVIIRKESLDSLSEEEKENNKEVIEILKKYNVKDSMDNLSKEDYENYLKDLGVSSKLVDEIHSLLNQKSKKEDKKENTSNIGSWFETYNKNEETNRKLNEKLNEKLLEYVDFSRVMEPKRYLNRKEINLVLGILNELKYNEEDIKNLVRFNDYFVRKQPLIEQCSYILDMARFYSGPYAFEDKFNEFEEYYNRYLEELGEDKGLYGELLEILYKEIVEILKTIPKTFEYELSIKINDFKLILNFD